MLKLFALIVMCLAAAFSLIMVCSFTYIFWYKDETFMFDFFNAPYFRVFMFFASIANAAIVLLYLLEWNC